MTNYYFLVGSIESKKFIVKPFIEQKSSSFIFEGQVLSSNNYKEKYIENEYINLSLYKITSNKKLLDVFYFLHENLENLDNILDIQLECIFNNKLDNNIISINQNDKTYTLCFSSYQDEQNNNYIFCPKLSIN